MATYAIGDVQGCMSSLTSLLDKIDFDASIDRLWFTGDLVNRGPDSVGVLRFVRSLGDSAIVVLGNHDLHLLAAASDRTILKRHDTLGEVLSADDSDSLLHWLRSRPLMHRDAALGYTMVHAGLMPQWSLVDAQSFAREVEFVLRSDNYEEFFSHMYGDQPTHWDPASRGWERLRFITNVFTRMRFCDASGLLNLREKGAPGEVAASLTPWFSVSNRTDSSETILFGHWSTLGFVTTNNVVCLDSGCLWGGQLTAMRLDRSDTPIFQVDCEPQNPIG